MSRAPQIIVGTVLSLTGVGLMGAPILVLEQEPSKWLMGAGLAVLVFGLVVAWPGVMEGFSETLSRVVPQLGESADDDE